jgi:transposase-like protein
VIRLDQKAEILMKYFRENKSQRAISRELGISRTTVQKYIKEFESKNEALRELKKDEDHNKAEILLLIEEMASKPKYDTSKRAKIKLTDDVLKEIDELVSENEKNLTRYKNNNICYNCLEELKKKQNIRRKKKKRAFLKALYF